MRKLTGTKDESEMIQEKGEVKDVDVLLKLLGSETVSLPIDKKSLSSYGLYKQPAVIADTAARKGYKINVITEKLFQIEKKKASAWFYYMSNTPVPIVFSARDKNLTKKILHMAGISVPSGSKSMRTLDRAVEYFNQCEQPQVLKPVSGAEGLGVTLNITSLDQLKSAVKRVERLASKGTSGSHFVLEDYFVGRDVRIVMVGEEVVSALVREPASVEGDGEKSIKELVEEKNKLRLESVSKPKIRLTKIARDTLGRQGYQVDSVIPKGYRVYLDDRGNVNAGADAITILPYVHPSYLEIAKNVKNQFPNLDYIGIDFLIKDFTKPAIKHNYVVIEVNARPALTGSMFPTHGEPVDIASKLMDYHVSRSSVSSASGVAEEVTYKADWSSFPAQLLNMRLWKEAAHRQGLKVTDIGRNYFEISDRDGIKKVHFYKGVSTFTSSASKVLMDNKNYAKGVMKNVKVNTPSWKVFGVNDVENAYAFAEKIKNGYVIKPPASKGGKGVMVNIDNRSSFMAGIEKLKALGFENLIVEERVSGLDYRLFVVGGEVRAAAQRIPANVIGDGEHTIRELIREKNKKRGLNPYLKHSLIKIDSEVVEWVRQAGYTLDAVPSHNEHIRLRGAANVSSGGDCIDVTSFVHKDFRDAAKKVYKAFGQPYHFGLDVMAEDISKSGGRQTWNVLEANTSPDIGMHHFPSQGVSRDAAGKMLEIIFDLQRNESPKIDVAFYEVVNIEAASVYLRELWVEGCSRGLEGGIFRFEADHTYFALSGYETAVESFLSVAQGRLNIDLVKLKSDAEIIGDLSRKYLVDGLFCLHDECKVVRDKEYRTGTHFILEGKVQSVGFRKWLAAQAGNFHINGWVRNLEGNKLEGVFQGQEHRIHQLLNVCAVGPQRAYVENVYISEIVGESVSGFSIKKSVGLSEIGEGKLKLYSRGPKAASRAIISATSKAGKRKEIYNYIEALEFSDLTPEAIQRAKLLILDALGLMILASADSRMDNVRAIGSNLSGAPESSLPLSKGKLSSSAAAFVMSCYMQLHDFNDGHRIATARGGDPHPGRVVIPVALAEAERSASTGKELLTAVVAGYDVAGKIRGRRPHRPKSPQYAAAAVAAKLRGFEVPKISCALGYAGYLSSSGFGAPAPGSDNNFLSKGFQSYSGILAAQVAETGQRGPRIEFGEDRTLPFLLSEAGSGFEVTKVYIKPYPTCRMTHSAIEALRDGMAELSISFREIEEIMVRQLPTGMYVATTRPTPRMSYKSAQFNMYYCLARYAMDREISVTQFSQEKISDPEVYNLSKRIKVVSDSKLSHGYPLRKRTSIVKITTKDGRSIEKRVDLASGSAENLHESLVMEKFMKNCSRLISEERAREIFQAVMKLEELENIESLVESLV